jgi:predicted permease
MSRQVLTKDTFASVTQSAGLMLLAMTVSALISIAVVKMMKVPQSDRGVYRMLLTFTNNGFMGYPLSLAVFGEDGLFLMIIANAIFMIYLYSVGIILLIYDKDGKMDIKSAMKSILSIPFITSAIGLLMFFFGIHLPFLVENFLKTIGDMTIPLSMLIIGIQLTESRVRDVLTNKYLYITMLLKLIVMPVLLFGLFVWLPFNSLAFCIVIFAMTLPSAAVIPVLSDLYGTNTKVASQGVFLTTMLSMITIPIYALLLTLYLGN